ncbi:MAG: insulinase family protein [Blastocatellia bacterium]|nr:insulinase family protein [Blastocatellia bacterium]
MKACLHSVLALTLLSASTCPPALAGQAPVPALKPAAAAVTLPQGVQRITKVEGITEYRLENGLKVLLFPDQSKATITVNITYLVGSRNEGYGETGMAHLLEHMVFKGTPNHPNIPQELTEHGARPNGTTNDDRTNYFETFQPSEENLKWALDLEADRMVNSFIAKKDLDSEMTVVRNEFERGENSPNRILNERIASTAFLWHNYGKSTIGAKSDLENVPIERLQAFYKTYYQPDNAVLLVTGKIDEAKTLELIKEKFGKIPRPSRKLIPTYTLDPVQDGERVVTLRRAGDIQLAATAYHMPAAAHPDAVALQVLAGVLSDEPTGRLYKNLVETKLATSVDGGGRGQREPGLLSFEVELAKNQSLDKAREILIKTVEQEIITQPPTQAEIDRVKKGRVAGFDIFFNSSDQVGLALSEFIALGDWRMMFLLRDRMKKVTVEDVQRVAKTYLVPSNRTLGLFIPEEKPVRAEIPVSPDVTAQLNGYTDTQTVASGEEFDPTPENIEARTLRMVAANGFQIVLLPKKTRGNRVNATFSLRFGNEKALTNRDEAGNLAGAMLMMGTAKHNRQQLKEEMDRLKALGFAFGSSTQAGGFVETTRENLAEVLKLMAEVLQQPAFPEAEFEKLKLEQATGIESRKGEPQAIVFREFSRYQNAFPKGHVFYSPTVEEQLEALKGVTLDEVKKFYRDFYGASNGELVVVGDFEPKEVESLAKELFGSWKSPVPYERIANPFREVAPLVKSFETPDKANAVVTAGMLLNLKDEDPDYPALVLGNYMLGGGFLNSRLAVRIRQKEGLSYTVNSSLTAGSQDNRGSFRAFAICAPQNAERVEKAMKEELDRMLKDGFTAEEVEAAKTGYLQSRKVSRAQDRELATKLASFQTLKRTLRWDAALEAKIAELKPEQIVAAMRKHIDPAKLIIFKAGDFAKANATATK